MVDASILKTAFFLAAAHEPVASQIMKKPVAQVSSPVPGHGWRLP
jgi:hypothetical protein